MLTEELYLNIMNYKLEEFQRFGRLFAVLFADIDNFSRRSDVPKQV